MSRVKFLDYTPVIDLKYEGIATVRVGNSLILRYKVLKNKNGHFFAAPGSFKQEEEWVKWFDFDEKDINKEVQEVILANVK